MNELIPFFMASNNKNQKPDPKFDKLVLIAVVILLLFVGAIMMFGESAKYAH